MLKAYQRHGRRGARGAAPAARGGARGGGAAGCLRAPRHGARHPVATVPRGGRRPGTGPPDLPRRADPGPAPDGRPAEAGEEDPDDRPDDEGRRARRSSASSASWSLWLTTVNARRPAAGLAGLVPVGRRRDPPLQPGRHAAPRPTSGRTRGWPPTFDGDGDGGDVVSHRGRGPDRARARPRRPTCRPPTWRSTPRSSPPTAGRWRACSSTTRSRSGSARRASAPGRRRGRGWYGAAAAARRCPDRRSARRGPRILLRSAANRLPPAPATLGPLVELHPVTDPQPDPNAVAPVRREPRRHRQPGQAPRLRLPLVGDLRRHQRRLGLRAARRRAEEQRQARLVAGHGPGARRHRRARRRDPHAPQVWVTSGHVAEFSDPLVECATCQRRYRVDEFAGHRGPRADGAAGPGRSSTASASSARTTAAR